MSPRSVKCLGQLQPDKVAEHLTVLYTDISRGADKLSKWKMGSLARHQITPSS
jgi:hypothetical protein